jgi:uncharacterized protein
MSVPDNPYTVAHWRRTVGEMYATVRRASWAEQPVIWAEFRAARNALYKDHPQSPLPPELRTHFSSLRYYPYDPDWRIIGVVDRNVAPETLTVELPVDGLLRYTRVARVRFVAQRQTAELSVFWIEGYGGGVFLPFRDATSGRETYGSGRYLYDAIKGADLGGGPDEMILDFNYAYNPPCAYDPQIVCPMPPSENRLPFSVEAGERAFEH